MEINKLSYEEGIVELQNILECLEKDNQTLNESLEMFKKGIEIYKHCNNILATTEGEIKILIDGDNSLEEVDFLREEDGYF